MSAEAVPTLEFLSDLFFRWKRTPVWRLFIHFKVPSSTRSSSMEAGIRVTTLLAVVYFGRGFPSQPKKNRKKEMAPIAGA